MNIVQLGACVGNDDLTKLIGDTQPNILVLVEPMSIHNKKIKECYKKIKNKHIENIAILADDREETSFFYDEKDGPNYEISSVNLSHILKHYGKDDSIKELKVKCLTINQLFEKFNLKKIDILFMDTEGNDSSIIENIDFDSFDIDEIYFENIHLSHENIYDFLEEKGYDITKNWGHMGWTSFCKKKR